MIMNNCDSLSIKDSNVTPSSSVKPYKIRHLRIPVEIRVEVAKNKQSFTTTSRNISITGVSTESVTEFQIGDNVDVVLYVPIKKDIELLEIEARVIWVCSRPGSCSMGAAFKKFAPGDQRKLRRWLLDYLIIKKNKAV